MREPGNSKRFDLAYLRINQFGQNHKFLGTVLCGLFHRRVDIGPVPGYFSLPIDATDLAAVNMQNLWSLQVLAAWSLVFIAASDPAPEWLRDEIPFVPTPVEVADRMLDLAGVTKDDIVYDLGSGDGRIVIRAAKRFGARGVGFEIDSDLVKLSRIKAAEEGVSHLVEFREQDALTADVTPATVVTLYMLPWFNEKIRPILQRQLRPGARVVSHDFDIPGWPPTKVVESEKVEVMPGGRKHRHRILLWTIEDSLRLR